MAKFIVIDGLDGCGKQTQVARVSDVLSEKGYKVVKMDFPNYESESSAAVKMYLHGELGTDPVKLNPYVCSSFYAMDRVINYIQTYSKYFEDEDDNTIVISDRFISANIIYQGAKIKDIEERKKFVKWCYDYECGLCGLPKEDMTILLTIPPHASQELMSKRYNGDESKKDIHEANVEYLNSCYKTLLDTKEFINKEGISNWKHLDCYDYTHEKIQSMETITDNILALIDYSLDLGLFKDEEKQGDSKDKCKYTLEDDAIQGGKLITPKANVIKLDIKDSDLSGDIWGITDVLQRHAIKNRRARFHLTLDKVVSDSAVKSFFSIRIYAKKQVIDIKEVTKDVTITLSDCVETAEINVGTVTKGTIFKVKTATGCDIDLVKLNIGKIEDGAKVEVVATQTSIFVSEASKIRKLTGEIKEGADKLKLIEVNSHKILECDIPNAKRLKRAVFFD